VRVLLDENTPVQLVEPLRRVLRAHTVDHVDGLRWTSKKDRHLIPDAATRGYAVLVTKDSNQLDDPDECDALRRAGIHHVRFRQAEGLKGLARAMASVIAVMPEVMDDLAGAGSQRLVRVTGIGDGKRHDVTDPQEDPPRYWRGAQPPRTR
jgi:hypothetical protein